MLSYTNATRIEWHLWEIDLRFAPGYQGVDLRSRGKHDAWKDASGNSRSESMVLYVHTVNAIEVCV